MIRRPIKAIKLVLSTNTNTSSFFVNGTFDNENIVLDSLLIEAVIHKKSFKPGRPGSLCVDISSAVAELVLLKILLFGVARSNRKIQTTVPKGKCCFDHKKDVGAEFELLRRPKSSNTTQRTMKVHLN